MRILVQWSRRNPRDWEELDSADWANTPQRPERQAGQLGGQDDNPGWVHRLNVQGVEFTADHYAVEHTAEGCRVYQWDDDPRRFPEGSKYAIAFEFLTLAPDPRLGGAINTRQRRVIFAQADAMTYWASLGKLENTGLHTWEEFLAIKIRLEAEGRVRHGILVTDDLNAQHDAIREVRGWREWTEGAELSQIILGPSGKPRIRAQRLQGRYNKPTGTKTYYASNTALVSHHTTQAGGDADEYELAPPPTGTPASDSSGNFTSDTNGIAFVFTTPSGEPNSDAWPSGNYRFQMDVTAAGANLSYGLAPTGTDGHFARVDASVTSDLETKYQTEGLFSGTGLQLATTGPVSWSPGSAGDRFECAIAAGRPLDHGNQSITLELNEWDDFADGPWTAGGQTLSRTVTEDVSSSFADVIARLAFIARGAIEDVSASFADSLSRIFGLQRGVSEDFSGLTDSVSGLFGVFRTLAEDFSGAFSDSVARAAQAMRGLTEDISGAFSDALARLARYFRVPGR